MSLKMLNLSTSTFITSTLATICVSLAVTYLGKIWYSYRYFKRLGIKTPPYSFFFGHYKKIYDAKAYSTMLQKWTQEYGKVYGIYKGHLPILVTSDVDLIQEIFIKQFTNFSPRITNSVSMDEDDPRGSLIFAAGSRWKRMRNIMNPTFSTAKLRDVTPLLVMCTDRLIEVMNNKMSKDKELNITETLKRYSLDAIWNCAFGIDINIQDSDNDIYYYKKCEEFFKISESTNIFSFIGIYMHEFKTYATELLLTLANLSLYFNASPEKIRPYPWLMQNVTRIVKTRKEENIRKKDYLQLILDAETTNFDFHTKFIDHSKAFFEKKLSNEEIIQNLILFMIAGYETTSTTLSVCFYILAKYPQEQQRLVDEINSLLENVPESEINGDNAQKLPYLDMFFKEVLRMYPIVNSIIGRRCVKETTINGIEFPENLTVVADVLSVHYNPDVWGPHDPNEFYPERFSPGTKRAAAAFLGFGLGPRNCIGMKFAFLEAKLALVRILMNFEILPSKNFPDKLEFVEGIVRKPKDGVNICLKPRKIID